ncbi:hypothetical protein GGI20_001533 [Coemansia sp. BCRC 34301]|nr:hypothetical protein GGI20_001533 [Coemansia sp. BCRC 34301]
MPFLGPSFSKNKRPPRQLGVPKPRRPLRAWSEATESDTSSTRRAHSSSVNGAAARLDSFRARSTLQSEFDGYLSDGSHESSVCEQANASHIAASADTQSSRRKYLNRHVSTELDNMALPEPIVPDQSYPRPSWSTISRRLSLGTAANRFARAPAKVPSTARATGASLSIHRPNLDEAPTTRGRTSWLGTIKMKLSARGGRRDRLDDQDTAPIVRNCGLADRPAVKYDETTEGVLQLASVASPTQPEPVSVYPRLRSQPSLNRPASARQCHHAGAGRNASSGAQSHAVADVTFVPEEGHAGGGQAQSTSPPHPSGTQRRSQFLLPHRRSLASDDRSSYTKLDEFDSA